MASKTNNISAWEDDPGSGAEPIVRPKPELETTALRVKIKGKVPEAKIYNTGTKEFRYWAAAEALHRGIEFWGKIVPSQTHWQPGQILDVWLDQGIELNAYYGRSQGLSFYHDTVNGVTVYSGESPDIVCHELGHAILDALRPGLFDVNSLEHAAFHEAFADISAILSALQLPSLRQAVLAQDGGLYRASRLSRLAEQLGWALHERWSETVEPDCLRNAVNSFYYTKPEELPPLAPAWLLSTSPHSFSRIFTGALFYGLSEMLQAQADSPTEEDLLEVSCDMGKLLIYAVVSTPIVTRYYSQLAIHMIQADAIYFERKYNEALKAAFVRHGILSYKAANSIRLTRPQTARRRQRSGMVATLTKEEIEDLEKDYTEPATLALSVSDFGLKDFGITAEKILVHAPLDVTQARRAGVAGSSSAGSPAQTRKAVESFVEGLFAREQIDVRVVDNLEGLDYSYRGKTHIFIETSEGLMLSRRAFSSGLDSDKDVSYNYTRRFLLCKKKKSGSPTRWLSLLR